MKKKWILFIILWPLFLMSLGFWLLTPHKGFSADKIRSDMPSRLEWTTSISQTDREAICAIFSQPFTYYAQGAQCYAFISQDQNYIIKFFKMNHLRPKLWLNYIPIPHFLDRYRYQKIDQRQKRLQETFGIYKTAYEEFPSESALIYVHLNPTNEWNLSLKVYDKENKCYLIDLDAVPFVLQNKVELIYDRLEYFLQRNDVEKAEEAIARLLYLIQKQCRNGFYDKDHGISQNYGFYKEEVVHFDLGDVVKDPALKEDPSHVEKETQRVCEKLCFWLSEHYPEHLSHFEEFFQNLFTVL